MNDEAADVEAILGSLDPAPSSLDFAEVIYRAGRASAGARATTRRRARAGWLWPCLAAASFIAAATFGTMWISSGEPEVVERIVYVERKLPSAAEEKDEKEGLEEKQEQHEKERQPVRVAIAEEEPSKTWNEYLEFRRLVLTEGLNALPEVDPPPRIRVDPRPWNDSYDPALERWFRS